jgi:spermidine synthase
MEHRLKLSSIFLLSVALIAFELSTMRVFAVGNWSNFGSLVISTALLGFGVSGTLLTFIIARVRANIDGWMVFSGMLFVPTMAMGYVVSQFIPFSPVFIGSDPNQILWIGVYYLVYGVPFFFGALFIGVSFIGLEARIHQIYLWNMLGSGTGGVLVLLLMYVLPPDSLVIPIILIAFLANMLCALRRNDRGRLEIQTRILLASTLGLAVSLIALFLWGDIRVSEYKAISYVRKYPDVQEVHRSYSPVGEMTVFASPSLHFAPGLSDVAILQLDTIPTQPFWGLYVDGNGPIGIMGKMEQSEVGYADFLPMAAPYTIIDKPNVLLVNLAGGISAQVAKAKGAKRVTIVERNPELLRLMRDDPKIAAFTGNLLGNPDIRVELGEARAYCVQHPSTFDIVEISLIDSIGLSESGGYPVEENYTYTSEAISEYMTALKDDGVLSITVWNRLNPPRNVLKLLTTIMDSMRAQGVEHPEYRIVMFDLFLSTATILVKKTDLTAGEVYDLSLFARQKSFTLDYKPGMERGDKDLNLILDTYVKHFEMNQDVQQNLDFTPSDIYRLAFFELIAGRGNQLCKRYVFDIRPMHDYRPYYTGYLKMDKIFSYLDQVHDVSEDWGYLLLLGILAQAIVMGLLVIFMPVAGRWRELFKRRRGTVGVIFYFACLGLGYMMVEVFLIQKLVFILTDPIYSVSIVITSMLILSGIGNLVASRFSKTRKIVVRVACGVIVAMLLFYIFGLTQVLNHFREQSLFVRILVAVGAIAPCAFFMGMPFPNGLDALSEHRPGLLPWAWGMNGGLSVAGTALAWTLTASAGFNVLLILVIVAYGVVGFLFTVNEMG